MRLHSYIIRYNSDMSINGDCPYCGEHSTEDEWEAWNGECQWCGEFDVEWERGGEKVNSDDLDGLDENLDEDSWGDD